MGEVLCHLLRFHVKMLLTYKTVSAKASPNYTSNLEFFPRLMTSYNRMLSQHFKGRVKNMLAPQTRPQKVARSEFAKQPSHNIIIVPVS